MAMNAHTKYRPYPSYERSGAPWIGEYPSNWQLTRVKFVTYVKARVGWHGLKSDDFTDEGPYLVTGSDFIGSAIKWENCYHCDVARYDQDPYIQLQNGDLLITKDGTIGKVALVKDLDGKATLNSGVFVVRPVNNRYKNAFYFWLLQSTIFTGFVDFNKTGSTIVHLYQDTFVNFKYALPSLPEQAQIAAFLDHETGKIDVLIAKQQRLIKLLEEKRQAVISHAVTKGLNPNAPTRPSGIDWLGEIPAHWEMKKLKYLCNFSGGGTPSKEVISFWQDGTIPWVSPKDMKHFYLTDTQDKITPAAVESSSTNYVESGALLMVVRSGILQRTIPIAINQTRVTLNQDMKAIRFNDKMTTEYAANYILGHQNALLLAWSKEGATVESIEQEYLSQHLLPVPPIGEQEEICTYLKTQKKLSKVLRDKARSAIDLLAERRTALISAAVTGKIDVRDWQPQQSNSAQQFEATETIGA